MRWPKIVKDEEEAEAYDIFDKNVRRLPRNKDGKIDPSLGGFYDNDVDAFRHAYVSGVFTQEYNETAANVFGQGNELLPADLYSNSNNPGSENMDLWNNSIGRKYGAKTKSRKGLAKKLLQALKKGELITNPNDKRKYDASRNKIKSVIVLKEGEKGRNEFFYDVRKKQILTAAEFIALIENGSYPDYSIKVFKGIPTPVSRPDGRGTNNLG